MTQHTPGPRCSVCSWVHEADSVAGTSFQGVGLCPLHAQAEALREALLGMLEWSAACVRGANPFKDERLKAKIATARAVLKACEP